MKNAFVGLILIVFLVSTAQAAPQGQGNSQGQSMRGGGQGNRMAHFQESLGLSDEQVQQIRSLRQNGGGREDIRAVLTDEQRVMLDEQRASRQGRGGKGMGPGRGYGQGPGPAANNPYAEPAESPEQDNAAQEPANG